MRFKVGMALTTEDLFGRSNQAGFSKRGTVENLPAVIRR